MANSGNQVKFTKRTRLWTIIAVIVLAVVALAITLFDFVTDYIWMDSLSFGKVYTKILYSKVILAASGFALFFILTFLTVYFIRLSYMNHFSYIQLPVIVKKPIFIYPLMILASLIVGMVGSSIVQGIGWEPTLKLLNYAEFDKVDPYFGKDISFYMFVLPFIEFILYTLLNLFVFFGLVQIGAYSVFRMYRMSRHAQIHLASTVAIVGVILAAIHYLGKFNTLLTDQVNIAQKSVVYGLSYTDKLINVPKAYVLAGVVIIAAIWLTVVLFRGKIHQGITPIIVYITVIIVGQVASIVVQNFIVSPNEFTKEKPFLEHNLEFTRAAYDLDSIQIKDNPGNGTLTDEIMERNELTINNIRLNDSRPLLDIYNQLQTFRTYYQFNNIDIDRYMIDGKYEQVFLGARELSTKDLPEQAQTWVNKNLRYTHGYGVAMSHVNKVTKQGQPEYMLRNIPVEGKIDVTRPQIYFGEEKYPNVIVNSNVEEFDYPTGDENANNVYEEDLGIQLQGLNKILFAIKEKSFRMFVSDQLTDESQLLQTRNIMDRVKKIAPFFTYDEDPYIVIRDDGTMVWLIDAYVAAANYPYSESYDGNYNYIRNSVKVSVDAYSGEVNYYNVHPEDPIIQTYANIFPELFTEEIPEDIKAHFRYPVDLFKIQTAMYGTYHMSNLEIFYNREDFWEIPTEKYADQDIEMDPYYITMKLPENDQEEFILMTPYTPKKRQNMISWMGVRNDGDNYGELFVYRFPKQRNIYGPQQIENRINQDSVISQQLNLWSQGGSEVIRGNLLVIPIEDTVLYVEPIYIESSNESSLPEVKQVVIAYEDQIVMEETFEKALDKILSGTDPTHDGNDKGKEDQGDKQEDSSIDESDDATNEQPIKSAEERLKEIGDVFDEYQDALSNGNWEKAGALMEELQRQINQMP